MLTFGSLFAGIGGMDLGLERAGLQCRWQVEIDPFCRRVLAKHWPDVARHDDVRTFPPESGEWQVDLIAGGFPCQDVSNAGPKIGIDGERSGLWSEYARTIGILRPSYVVVENVPSIRSRGFGRVLGDMAKIGYDAEWDCLPASFVGAHHQRDRIFIVAYPQGQRGRSLARGLGRSKNEGLRSEESEGEIPRRASEQEGFFSCFSAKDGWRQRWPDQPGLGRLVHGISDRMVKSRNHALGNAVVPALAQLIGQRILEISK